MKLTITTLVIVEGSYIQGIFHSLEEHPGKASSGRDDNPIYLLLQCHQEMGIQSQGNRNPPST